MNASAREIFNHIAANRLLLGELGGKYADQTVYVLGSGPSLLSRPARRPGPTIALNSAVAAASDVQVWLTCESGCFLFPWFRECPADFRGVRIMEQSVPYLMGEHGQDPLDFYPREWWDSAVYCNRAPWEGNHGNIREPIGTAISYGTVRYIYEGEGIVKNAGGVLWAAIHLAGIMGAKRVVLYGCEQGWRAGQDQHFDGWNVYTKEYADANTGQCDLMEIQGWHTQRLYVEAAMAIQPFMRQCAEQGMEVINRSGGLLDLDLTGAL